MKVTMLHCIVFLAVVASSVMASGVANLYPEYKTVALTQEELKASETAQAAVEMRMTIPEVAFFLRMIKASKSYFEFGSGGSTRTASAFGPSGLNITAVDSSKEWIGIVLQDKNVKAKVDANLLRIEHVDIGPIRDWGRPVQSAEESKGAWYLYSQAIGMLGGQYDLVLVDGRFRVACVLNTFMTNPNAKVLVHDFFDPRHHDHYKVLLSVMDVVERIDTLVHLRVKPSAKRTDMMKMYATHMNVMH